MPYGHELLESVGIELEVTSPTEPQCSDLVNRTRALRGWRVHHDGSTQQAGWVYRGLPYNLRHLSKSHGNLGVPIQTGAEIVSPILNTATDKWMKELEYVCDWLSESAKEIPGLRTSVHVHVNAGSLPLYVLKNLLRLWSFLEAPIFRLSCGELPEHRGQHRKMFSYCRPLSSPPVVFDREGILRPSYSVPSLLKAETLDDFFWGYGANDVQSEPIRYHPARYSALNLLSLLTIHTVEFRTFNESINPDTIKTWVDLSKAVVRSAMQTKGLGDDDYQKLPLGYTGEFDLSTFQVLLDLNDETMRRIEGMWVQSNWQEFNGHWQFNSNNENTTLNWPTTINTLPPSLDGEPILCYAPGGNGRHSEDALMVFRNRSEYERAVSGNYLSETEALDRVARLLAAKVKKPAAVAAEPRPSTTVTPDEIRQQSRPAVRTTRFSINPDLVSRIEELGRANSSNSWTRIVSEPSPINSTNTNEESDHV